MVEREEEPKSLLMKVKEESEEDHGIRSHLFMVNRCGNMETMKEFIFVGSKISADKNDFNLEIK